MSPDDCLPDDDESLLLLAGNLCASCVPVGHGARLLFSFQSSPIPIPSRVPFFAPAFFLCLESLIISHSLMNSIMR